MNKLTRTSLAKHCSFRIGGITDNYAAPDNCRDLLEVLKIVKKRKLQPIICGYGANILFPDEPGNTLCFISLKNLMGFNSGQDRENKQLPCIKSSDDDNCLSVLSGTPASFVALMGLLLGEDYDFTYLLPGSIGAALYMNARYKTDVAGNNDKPSEMSEIVSRVHYIDIDEPEAGITSISAPQCMFGYKQSIFQQHRRVITAVDLVLRKSSSLPIFPQERAVISIQELLDEISHHTISICDVKKFYEIFKTFRSNIKRGADYKPFDAIESHRERYRHFAYPSAGSIFKNSRELGKPIGAVIDELGLKGTRSGDAVISPYHGNIIINTGRSKAQDILKLIDIMTESIFKAYCFKPELELKIIEE